MNITNLNRTQTFNMVEYKQAIHETKFSDFYEGIKDERGEMFRKLKEWAKHPAYNDIFQDALFMKGEATNADPGEDEHFWYEWDVNKLQIGTLVDETNEAIHVSTFKIKECWHRERMMVEPLTTLRLTANCEESTKVEILVLHDWYDIELNAGWFDAEYLIEDEMIDTNAITHEITKSGLNVMNLMGFHWGVNFLCRY